MSQPLLHRLDTIRQSLNGVTCRKERSEIGQFLTPGSISQFMALLFGSGPKNVRILDPGAGAGVLFSACVDAFVSREPRPRSIGVVAYETDTKVLPYLHETMERCGRICGEAGIAFCGEVKAEDFVAGGLTQAEESLFGTPGEPFTHAILNPPYKKINGETETRRLLDAAGMEVSNLYAAFVWVAARMLKPGGELAAITPRSFCNGPYFRRFRVAFLSMMSLHRIHVFESRSKAFGDDSVLQENVIFHAVREDRRPKHVTVSSSEGADFNKASVRRLPYEQVVLPEDRDAFVHLVLNEGDDRVMERMGRFGTGIEEVGLEVSTGRVVDFRAREHLRAQPEARTAPLIYPCHFRAGFVSWPAERTKKPNAIVSSAATRDLMVTSGYYVLTKRFTSKEERRRVVAAVYDPQRIEAPLVGFENHLNYFHVKGEGLSPNLAKGLALYLNSSLFDQHFRLFSGHTQVNATDLRKMRYPSREQLLRLGAHVRQQMPDQETIDTILEMECGNDG